MLRERHYQWLSKFVYALFALSMAANLAGAFFEGDDPTQPARRVVQWTLLVFTLLLLWQWLLRWRRAESTQQRG